MKTYLAINWLLDMLVTSSWVMSKFCLLFIQLSTLQQSLSSTPLLPSSSSPSAEPMTSTDIRLTVTGSGNILTYSWYFFLWEAHTAGTWCCQRRRPGPPDSWEGLIFKCPLQQVVSHHVSGRRSWTMNTFGVWMFNFFFHQFLYFFICVFNFCLI